MGASEPYRSPAMYSRASRKPSRLELPEAVWSNLGLTYLAHTHIPTVWTQQGVELEKLEWTRRSDGTLDFERTLPNGIVFGTKVTPTRDAVWMESWLTNGTDETLRSLRVQNCVMLKGAVGFDQLTKENKVLSPPYVACRSPDGQRWIITAWDRCRQPWANPPVPCMHSDSTYPDCAPGRTQRIKGFVSFYEGPDVETEFRRLDATGWRQERSH